MFTRPRQLTAMLLLFIPLAGCDSDSNLVSPDRPKDIARATTPGTVSSVSYDYLPFDVPAELGAYTTAYGNNDHGAVVGNYGALDGSVHGFLFDGHDFIDIVVPGSSADDHGSLSDINDAGVAIGSFIDAETEIGHGYLRSSTGEITVLPDPSPDAVSTEAAGVNNSGMIVGSFFDDAGGLHGFIRRFGNTLVYDYPNAVRTRLNGLNNHGEITGQWSDGVHQHGFVLVGRRARPVEFPGAVSTRGAGINDSGDVVGFYTDADGVIHGFLYAGGRYTSLDYPGAPDSAVFGINNMGVITGTYDEFSRGMIVVPSHS